MASNNNLRDRFQQALEQLSTTLTPTTTTQGIMMPQQQTHIPQISPQIYQQHLAPLTTTPAPISPSTPSSLYYYIITFVVIGCVLVMLYYIWKTYYSTATTIPPLPHRQQQQQQQQRRALPIFDHDNNNNNNDNDNDDNIADEPAAEVSSSSQAPLPRLSRRSKPQKISKTLPPPDRDPDSGKEPNYEVNLQEQPDHNNDPNFTLV